MIKRYNAMDLVTGNAIMVSADNGHFVTYEDHLKAMREAQHQATDFLLPTEFDQEPDFWLCQLFTRGIPMIYLKALAAEKKYGHKNGWLNPGWEAELQAKVREHLEKGDPRDVAIYCLFAIYHGWSLTPGGQVCPKRKLTIEEAPAQK